MSISEEFYPLHLRLLSSNDAIKTTANDEFHKLDNKAQLNVLLNMVGLLEKE